LEHTFQHCSFFMSAFGAMFIYILLTILVGLLKFVGLFAFFFYFSFGGGRKGPSDILGFSS
jgi:hypothetical protein